MKNIKPQLLYVDWIFLCVKAKAHWSCRYSYTARLPGNITRAAETIIPGEKRGEEKRGAAREREREVHLQYQLSLKYYIIAGRSRTALMNPRFVLHLILYCLLEYSSEERRDK